MVVIFSTAMRLAYSPASAPPMPSLTAKAKSVSAVDAAPILRRRRTSVPLKRRARKESSLFGRTLPRSVQPDHFNRAEVALWGGFIEVVWESLLKESGRIRN